MAWAQGDQLTLDIETNYGESRTTLSIETAVTAGIEKLVFA